MISYFHLCVAMNKTRDTFSQFIRGRYASIFHGQHHDHYHRPFGWTWAEYYEELTVLDKEKFLLIRYEDLLVDPRASIQKILDFLAVDVAPHVIDASLRRSDIRVLRQKYKGTSTAKFYRVGKSKQWKTMLDDRDNTYLINRSGPILDHFGYLDD